MAYSENDDAAQTSYRLSPVTFTVTLIDGTAGDLGNLERALRQAGGSLRFAIRHKARPVASSFPLAAVHAIVFTPNSLARATAADVDVIRSAMKPGTCRVYLLVPNGIPPPTGGSPLEDFVQRTNAYGVDAVAEHIIAFFRDADDLNRRSTLFALRDVTFLGAYRVLTVLWPLSYVLAIFHIINALAVLAGRGPWPSTLASRYVVPGATFLGAFFIVHCVFVILRNALFATRIVKRPSSGFALRAGALGLAAAATARSIAALDGSPLRVIVSMVLAAGAYLLYMYARRIRAECASLSQLQTAIADPRRRTELLNSIGRQPLTSGAFPFLPCRSRSLFVSYMHGSVWSSQTADFIQRITARVGFHVWMDQSSIPSGSLWRQYLLQALSECGFFIAVLDSHAAATEWVLAESAYAALLRKSIGKPRILLVVRNAEGLSRLQKGPFGVIYRDVFQLPSELCRGAGILVVGEDGLTVELFHVALQEVRPMCLLG